MLCNAFDQVLMCGLFVCISISFLYILSSLFSVWLSSVCGYEISVLSSTQVRNVVLCVNMSRMSDDNCDATYSCSDCFVSSYPLSSIAQHLSYSDCLKVKTEDYQNCSVLYCVIQLCTIICTLT